MPIFALQECTSTCVDRSAWLFKRNQKSREKVVCKISQFLNYWWQIQFSLKNKKQKVRTHQNICGLKVACGHLWAPSGLVLGFWTSVCSIGKRRWFDVTVICSNSHMKHVYISWLAWLFRKNQVLEKERSDSKSLVCPLLTVWLRESHMNFELGFMYRMEIMIPTSEVLRRIKNCICRMSDTPRSVPWAFNKGFWGVCGFHHFILNSPGRNTGSQRASPEQ